MNKRHLSAFRRSPWMTAFCLLILTFMLCPVGVMAASGGPVLPVASVGGWNPMLAGAVGLGVIGLGLRAAADDNGGGGGGGKKDEAPDPKEALAQAEDRTLPMGQRLSVAISALRGVDATGQLAAKQQELTDVTAKLTAKDAELTAAQSEVTRLKSELAARETDVKALEESNASLEKANKDLAAKEQDIDKRAESKSKEKLASLGFPASQLPPPSSELTADVPQTEAQLEAALKECKTQEERSTMLRAFRARQQA